MNKHLTLIASGLLLSAGTAMAGDITTPVVFATQIVPPPAAAQSDWSGFYAGGLVSFDSAGDMELFANGNLSTIYTTTDATSFGGFAGYNFQNGAFVYGVEVAVTSGGVSLAAIPEASYGAVLDLKARAGLSFGRFLAYGVIGGASTSLPFSFSHLKKSGFTYGAGVEFLVNQNLFVGAEYLVRDLAGPLTGEPQFNGAITIQSTQLRVGWKF